MDGAPYLRKIDLKTYCSYAELSSALEKMFSCFTIGILLLTATHMHVVTHRFHKTNFRYLEHDIYGYGFYFTSVLPLDPMNVLSS